MTDAHQDAGGFLDDGPHDVLTDEDPVSRPGSRRAPRAKRRGPGCLVALVILGLIFGGLYLGASKGVSFIQDQFQSTPDYPGPGTGSVTFEVKEGDTATQIGQNLAAQDVVKSTEAFVAAALADPDSASIQVGFYEMRKQMSSSDALALLIDSANRVSGGLTIREGLRVGEIVTAIVEVTDFSEEEVTALLDDPGAIGLPKQAAGNPEGYLFPATYDITPDLTAKALLSQMVDKTKAVAKDLKIDRGAAALGLTPHEIITVASILEYEGNNNEDYAKIARVLYNRLDQGMALQLDSTVTYISQRKGDVWTTDAERDVDSAYNTYKYPGLPPGPIGSPGEASIRAALNPADGPWLFFVPDFETGKSLFTESYAEHLQNVEKAKEYCRTHEEC